MRAMKTFLCLLLVCFVSAAAAGERMPKVELVVDRVLKDGVIASGLIEILDGFSENNFTRLKAFIYVTGVKNPAEGDKITGTVKPDGTYTFTDTAGSSRTVRKYVLEKEKAE